MTPDIVALDARAIVLVRPTSLRIIIITFIIIIYINSTHTDRQVRQGIENDISHPNTISDKKKYTKQASRCGGILFIHIYIPIFVALSISRVIFLYILSFAVRQHACILFFFCYCHAVFSSLFIFEFFFRPRRENKLK